MKVRWKKYKLSIQLSNFTPVNYIDGLLVKKKKRLFKNRKSNILCLVRNNPLQKTQTEEQMSREQP